MSKLVDITDKLNFTENPKLKIGELEVEVTSDAETVLKVMGSLSGDLTLEKTKDALELVFAPEDVKAITSLKRDNQKLPFSDLLTIVTEAMKLVMGEAELGE